EGENFIGARTQLSARVHFESESIQFLESGPVAVVNGLAGGEQKISIEIETPGRGDGGIERAESSGGGVAWIGETSQALLLALCVQAIESATVHDGFTADLQFLPGRDGERERSDSASVFGDLLSDQTVAARDRLREAAVAIVSGH